MSPSVKEASFVSFTFRAVATMSALNLKFLSPVSLEKKSRKRWLKQKLHSRRLVCRVRGAEVVDLGEFFVALVRQLAPFVWIIFPLKYSSILWLSSAFMPLASIPSERQIFLQFLAVPVVL